MKRKTKAQVYLEQVEKLDVVIANKLVEQQQWKDIALGITANMEGERVQSSCVPSKMADAVSRCVDMGAEVDRLIDKLVDLRKEITATIEMLGTEEYDVLHKKYIQGKDYYDIAEMKGRDYSWVTTVHGRALKNLQKILDERERAVQDGVG